MKTCPECKLINPPNAQRCDCGYDFDTAQIKESYLTERDKQTAMRHGTTAVGISLAVVAVRLIRTLFMHGMPATWQAVGAVVVILLGSVWLWKRRSSAH